MESRVAIALISGDSIINKGTLCSLLLDGQQRGARTICLVAPSVVNHGKIRCHSDVDEMYVFCSHFENTGMLYIGNGVDRNINVQIMGRKQITAILNEMLKSSEFSMSFWIQSLTANEEQIALKVDSHRGHFSEWGNYHIQNVLEEGTSSYYNSLGNGPPNSDWFVFRMQTKRRFIPKTIMIRNGSGGSALKRISISGKGDDEQLMEWMEIKNIRKTKEELQSFPVDPALGLMAFERGFRLFRIDVLENHGAEYQNAFYEFRIYGVYL